MANNMTSKLLICAVLVLSFMTESSLADDGYTAKFKGFFGRVVTKRTYPTEEMKQKALDIWKDKGVILELDGTTSKPGEDHANESHNTTPIPSVSEASASDTTGELVDSSGQKLEPVPEGEPIPLKPSEQPVVTTHGISGLDCDRLAGNWKGLATVWGTATIDISGSQLTYKNDKGRTIQEVCRKTGDAEWMVGNRYTFQLLQSTDGTRRMIVYGFIDGYTKSITYLDAAYNPTQYAKTTATATPQKNALSASGTSTPTTSGDAYSLMQNNGCLACHSTDRKILGPAFKDISARYKGTSGAFERLVSKVRKGGSGVWGPLPQPATPTLNEQTIRDLVAIILDGQNLTPNYANTAATSQLQASPTQDCSVLNGTWRTTFSSSSGDNKAMDWKWQASGNQTTIGMYETDGRLLSSAPLSGCTVSGNTVTYQIGATPQVRLELAGDKQSFTGASYANGIQISYRGQRSGGGATANDNMPPDQSASAVVDAGSVGVSRSFSFKPKKKK